LFDHEPLYEIYDTHQYYAHQDEIDWLFRPQSVGVHTGAAISLKHNPDYMDQVWPFDITLVAQNEYGQAAWSAIIGVEIINEGGGISMDDLTNERQATFIALHRTPWTPVNEADRTAGAESYSMEAINFNRDNTGYTVNPLHMAMRRICVGVSQRDSVKARRSFFYLHRCYPFSAHKAFIRKLHSAPGYNP